MALDGPPSNAPSSDRGPCFGRQPAGNSAMATPGKFFEQRPADGIDHVGADIGWKAIVARFQKPDALRASWQIVNTIGAYAALWVALYWSLSVSWWLTIPLSILAGCFLVRVFIIFH